MQAELELLLRPLRPRREEPGPAAARRGGGPAGGQEEVPGVQGGSQVRGKRESNKTQGLTTRDLHRTSQALLAILVILVVGSVVRAGLRGGC